MVFCFLIFPHLQTQLSHISIGVFQKKSCTVRVSVFPRFWISRISGGKFLNNSGNPELGKSRRKTYFSFNACIIFFIFHIIALSYFKLLYDILCIFKWRIKPEVDPWFVEIVLLHLQHLANLLSIGTKYSQASDMIWLE